MVLQGRVQILDLVAIDQLEDSNMRQTAAIQLLHQ